MQNIIEELARDLEALKKDSLLMKADRAEKIMCNMQIVLAVIVNEVEKMKEVKNASLG